MDGEFAVAGTLPTVQDVIDFKEGTHQYQYGYYRFVDHPYLREIKQALAKFYHRRHCIVMTSPQTAFYELFEHLIAGAGIPHVTVLTDQHTDSIDWRNAFQSYPGVKPHIYRMQEPDITRSQPIDEGTIWIISVDDYGNIIRMNDSFIAQITKQQAPLILFADHLESELPELKEKQFSIVNLLPGNGTLGGAAILSNSDRTMMALQNRMKQRGPILSSRNAARILSADPPPVEANDAYIRATNRIADLEDGTETFLYPSGMNAIASALDLVQRPGKSQVISIGHLYTDTYASLKFQQKTPNEEPNLFLGVDELDQLEASITDQTTAIITETITNPLNDVPDLDYLAKIARKKDITFLIDNTIATPFNCQPLAHGGDIVIHSTTKFFSGGNDHAGGAIVVDSPEYAAALRSSQSRRQNRMSVPEASILWDHIQDFEDRMARFNKNAMRVAEFLENQPAVKKVHFSRLPDHRSHHVAKQLLRGPGSLVSCILHNDTLEGLRTVYDTPMDHIIKAPTLGSNHTLICPYVMIAHYSEPEELLRELDLSRYLVRLAVGCEHDITPVLRDLERALG